MNFNLGFVEKKIAGKRITLLVGLFFLILVVCGLRLVLFLSEVEYMDFHFDHQAVVAGSEVSFEVSRQEIMIVGHAFVPMPETRTTRRYATYLMEGDGKAVVLLVPWRQLERVDLSSGIVAMHVDSQYQRFHQDIIEYLEWQSIEMRRAIGGLRERGNPIYIFVYSPGSTANVIEDYWVMIAVLVLASILSVIYLRPLQKMSKIGRQIAALGDYNEIAPRINEQVANAIFAKDSVWVTKDFLVLDQSQFVILPIRQITSVDSKPDQDYPDEIFHITVGYNEHTYTFTVYDEASERQVVSHIELNMICR